MVCSRLAKRFDLKDFAFAHRGLWSGGGPTENSLEAFQSAAEQGLGIEFDVRPSSDGTPIIFHDPTLDRMTETSGLVEKIASDQLIGTPLKGGGEIVALERLLEVWPEDLPLLCELKIDGVTDPETFAARVAHMFESYSGLAAMMSFSPIAVSAVPASIMRGQLLAPRKGDPSTDLAQGHGFEVDYLACHVDDTANPFLQKARSRMPLITWTVTSDPQCCDLSGITDSQIFEGFDPALAKRHILNR